jgi:hypothetical protein
MKKDELTTETPADAKPVLAAGLSTEHDLKTAIALGLDKCWDSDWIISTSKSIGGAIHFSVHLDYIGQIDTADVEIQTIEMDGCWLRLSGWVK